MSSKGSANEPEQIAQEAAGKLNPRTDGERVTYFNVILSAIERALDAQRDEDGRIMANLAKMFQLAIREKNRLLAILEERPHAKGCHFLLNQFDGECNCWHARIKSEEIKITV